ncbi:MAG: molybdopterin cofactor-binding domain-containing protein [Desulfobacula sp.]
MKTVNQGIEKIDAMALLTGKPVYTDDLAPENCLVVKVLRSPHAFAAIKDIDAADALKIEGVECILTHKDVPGKRFTMAGQSYPEPSPYDRLILDQMVRYVGDPVAIAAGISEKAVEKALKLIRVSYDVLDPVLNPDEALDHKTVIHPETGYHAREDIGNDVKRNLCASGGFSSGDAEGEFGSCDVIVDRLYHTKANNQAMMETHRTFSYLDQAGRLVLVTSTQIPFHVRRIAATALDIPKSRIRVIKPRIGGGFGAKQTLVSELFPALVTLKTGKPAKMVFDRSESFTASTSRHEMKIRVRVGADKDGHILAIHMDTLSNTGAYGEHGPTTVGLSGHKTMSLYNKAKAFKFTYTVVYTNTLSAGAYRGYGAPQGTFALESAVNELADRLSMDPLNLRLKNILNPGDVVAAYYGETIHSCALAACIQKGREMIGWDKTFPFRKISPTRVRAVGAAIAMQGSGIPNTDTASARIVVREGGFFTLMIGAADMGTGCDTILAQMAAETLGCDMEKIVVSPVDTDVSPYDTGSYASSTTYVTGGAVVRACEELKRKIESKGIHPGLFGSATHSGSISPPPFMAGFAEIEMDLETGETKVVDYVGVVDCGTPINPNLARVQAEGGIVQGIGMALYEDIAYNSKGRMILDSFMQYKIPSRPDVGRVRVAFEQSYEPTGPFGAKSIGEVVINTPAPAIAHAIHNAAGIYLRVLPMTAEKIVLTMMKGEEHV